MSDTKIIAPSPGLPSERVPAKGTADSGPGGTPPAQPHSPATESGARGPLSGHHPIADAKADVSHGPAIPGKRDGGEGVQMHGPRQDDSYTATAGAVMKSSVRQDATGIDFDWYPDSFAQVVTLVDKPMMVKSIVAKVITQGTDPGPTALTFRKAMRGASLTTGKALHTGSINLVGSSREDISGIEQIMALVHEDCHLEEGDCVAAEFSGRMADCRGSVRITLEPKK